MQELEDVQNSDVTYKFSERVTVELISKLTERNLIDVLKCVLIVSLIYSTRSGIREYVTWNQLETEIYSEIDSHGGRVSFQELEVAYLMHL